MTDDRTLADLDARGRAAAAGVRTAVTDRPVPVFDPDLVRIDVDARPERSRRSRPVVAVLAAAAAVLVVVAAVVALMGTGDPDSAPTDRVAPGDLRPYVLAALPDGFSVAVVAQGSDAEVGDTTSLDGPASLFGPDPSRPSVATAVVPLSDEAGCDLPDAPEDCEPEPTAAATEGLPSVEVDGRTAWDASDSVGGASVMVEVDGGLVLVIGPSSAEDAVRDAAAAVEVADDGRTTVPGDALPDGWSALGEVPLLSALGGVIQGGTVPAGGSSWAISYGPEADDGEEFEMVAVGVEAGGPLDVGLPGLLADEVEELEVRGHPARLARIELTAATDTTWWTVRWEERPGEVVEVAVTSSTGRFDRADVLALADGLVVAEPDVVEVLRDEAREQGLDDSGVTVLGRGTFSDGADWTLAVRAGDERREVEVRTEASSNGGVSGVSTGAALGPDGGTLPSDEAFPDGVTVSDADDYGWAYGTLRTDVATVEVRDGGGAVLTTVSALAADGIGGFVAQIPAELATRATDGAEDAGLVFVALDATGAELGRLEL